jgi:hypothetical protein
VAEARKMLFLVFEWSKEIGDVMWLGILGFHYSKTFIKLVSIQTPIKSANLQE